MPDQQDVQAAAEEPADLSVEIGSSLSSVWARYVGVRPSQSETQLEGSVVRWVVPGGTSDIEEAIGAETPEGEPPRAERTTAGFKRETAAVVAKATRRRVVAIMSKHDAKTGIATETFILEPSRRKY